MPLSAKQNTYLAIAWQCMDTEPKINYDHFKTLAGLASAASARELLRVTRKKLREEYGATIPAAAAEAKAEAKAVVGEGASAKKVEKARAGMSTPTSRGKKRKVCGMERGDGVGSDGDEKKDGSEMGENMGVKKIRKMGAKKAVVVKQEQRDDELANQEDSDEELL